VSHWHVTAPVSPCNLPVNSLRPEDIRAWYVREVGTRDLRTRKLIFNRTSHFSTHMHVRVLQCIRIWGCHWDCRVRDTPAHANLDPLCALTTERGLPSNWHIEPAVT